jgi:Trypsin
MQIQIGWSDDFDDYDDIDDHTEKMYVNDDDYQSSETKDKFHDPRRDVEKLDFNVFSVTASWECGGVLISENFVLTSAQCLGKRDK